jgi:hypothetical protein
MGSLTSIIVWVLWVKVLAAAFMVALLFLALVFAACFGTVQATTMWAQTYGGSNNDKAYSLVATSDGGYAIAGATEAVLFS